MLQLPAVYIFPALLLLAAPVQAAGLHDRELFDIHQATGACARRNAAGIETALKDANSMTTLLARRARELNGTPIKLKVFNETMPKTGGRFDWGGGTVKLYCTKKTDPAQTLRHELAHLLMFWKSGGKIPEDRAWVEGFASYVAGENTQADSVAGALRLKAGPAVPGNLGRLEDALTGANDLKTFLRNYEKP